MSAAHDLDYERLAAGFSDSLQTAGYMLATDIEHHLLVAPPRRRHIIPDVVPVGLSFMFGASGCGKSTLAVLIATSVGLGMRLGGRDVRRGAVAYIAAEDERGIRERIVAAIAHAGEDAIDCRVGLVALPEGGLASPKFVHELLPNLRRLEQAAGDPLALVILDTLAIGLGDSNPDDARAAGLAVRKLQAIAEQTGAAVLVIHHSGKVKEAGMRGSSVFQAAADAVINVFRSGDRTLLKVEKMRSGPGGTTLSVGVTSTTITVAKEQVDVQVVHDVRDETSTPSSGNTTGNKVLTKSDQALVILTEIAGVSAVTVDAWKTACFQAWSDANDGAQRTAFSKARTRLLKLGYISEKAGSVTVSVTGLSASKSVTQVSSQPGSASALPHRPLRGAGHGNATDALRLTDPDAEEREAVRSATGRR